MKTRDEIVLMQQALRGGMAGMKESGAPPQVIHQTAVALSSADDALKWVMGQPSELGKLEKEYNEQLQHLRNQ